MRSKKKTTHFPSVFYDLEKGGLILGSDESDLIFCRAKSHLHGNRRLHSDRINTGCDSSA